jgi:hypothetical protein
MRWLVLILLVSACGPPELPAFANPPKPPDAGIDAEDAGASDAARD